MVIVIFDRKVEGFARYDIIRVAGHDEAHELIKKTAAIVPRDFSRAAIWPREGDEFNEEMKPIDASSFPQGASRG